MTDETIANYRDPNLPAAERAADLVSRMTLAEKVSQMVHDAPGIERLSVSEYNWWNECLHGVARAGRATVFPQAIGLAASFDAEMLHRLADAISDEARAKHHQSIRQGHRCQYMGLTCWTPNINLFRDPRWGRGQETYGEDPHLTSRLGVAFVTGLQGDDPRYLKCVATPKHYAVHSGPESDRHRFDAVVSRRDLRETYLPAFEATVREARAVSVMGAYNRTNGEVCCGSETLLQRILRDEWGFAGYVVSDCGAVADFHKHHRVTAGEAESAALAVRNGCDLNCGCTYNALIAAVSEGLIDEAAIDTAVRRLFEARFRLGMFDADDLVPYARIAPEVVGCDAHRRLAVEMARESIVLLKNDGALLPLAKDTNHVLVVGPNAVGMDVLLANYFGYSDRCVTPLEGILAKVSVGTQVEYRRGCELTGEWTADFDGTVSAAAAADVIVACMGLTARLEGEEGAAADSDAGGDRKHIGLPGVQEELLQRLHATGKPVVLVLFSGSALSVPWAAEHIPAIVQAWYPGEQGGSAIADVLFGDYNPAGRLPVTVPTGLDQLPPFDDYQMAGRTYRFQDDEPLWRFGYGLSYATFAYANLRLGRREIAPDESVPVTVDVTNTSDRDGDEVVQLYVRDVEASVPVPIRHLEGFRRVHLAAGATRTVEFTLTPRQLSAYDDDGHPFVEAGAFEIAVGGGQPNDPAAGAVLTELIVR